LITNGNKGSQIYFTINGESDSRNLRQVGTIKKLKFDIDFASLSIKGRPQREIASKYPIKKLK
jgi:topoisomerase-4 subunit A